MFQLEFTEDLFLFSWYIVTKFRCLILFTIARGYNRSVKKCWSFYEGWRPGSGQKPLRRAVS